jgi:hypothetical protein
MTTCFQWHDLECVELRHPLLVLVALCLGTGFSSQRSLHVESFCLISYNSCWVGFVIRLRSYWLFRVRVTLQLTVSQSVLALRPSGTHGQILAVVMTVAVLLSWGVLPNGSVCIVTSHSPCLCWQYIHMYIFISFLFLLYLHRQIIIIIILRLHPGSVQQR